METKLLLGDCLKQLKNIKDNTIDSIVTDPPYGLSFMGKKWDYDVPSTEIWEECIRVLKPGGHLLSFGGSRTYHRMAVRIEDAGFEIRDQIMWVYGSGFPKSHNIGKSIDKLQGNEREVVGENLNVRKADSQKNTILEGGFKEDNTITKGTSQYEGWGTALKPAHEPIVMARKPFKGTVADNVLEWGTGGINIDGCRIGNEVRTTPIHSTDVKEDNTLFGLHPTIQHERIETTEGRFPANFILGCICDETRLVDDKYDIRTYDNYKNTFQSYEENDSVKGEYKIKDVNTKAVIHTNPNCPCYIMDEQSGERKGFASQNCNNQQLYGGNALNSSVTTRDGFKDGYNDSGGASRFFYCPKTSKKDRNEGCDKLENVIGDCKNIASKRLKCNTCGKWAISADYCVCENPEWIEPETKNNHPTVKPTDLMAYLIRLVTPKGGVVLDPFVGSGSTGKAAVREGMNFIGIEREEEYFEIAKQRIEWEVKNKPNTTFWE